MQIKNGNEDKPKQTRTASPLFYTILSWAFIIFGFLAEEVNLLLVGFFLWFFAMAITITQWRKFNRIETGIALVLLILLFALVWPNFY